MLWSIHVLPAKLAAHQHVCIYILSARSRYPFHQHIIPDGDSRYARIALALPHSRNAVFFASRRALHWMGAPTLAAHCSRVAVNRVRSSQGGMHRRATGQVRYCRMHFANRPSMFLDVYKCVLDVSARWSRGQILAAVGEMHLQQCPESDLAWWTFAHIIAPPKLPWSTSLEPPHNQRIFNSSPSLSVISF